MKKIIIANWKCNPKTQKEAEEMFASIENGVTDEVLDKIDAAICPPFVYLGLMAEKIKLGAQDCFWEEKGAFTGEISPLQLKDLGCEYVILGHSERRRVLKENDETINKKVGAVLKAGMKPILCVEKDVQLKKGIKGISNLDNLIVAFEPVSAIGTGKPYPLEAAKKSLLSFRKIVNAPILYGGSVSKSNAQDYIELGFDGLLVGSASLNPDDFLGILEAVK